MTQRLAREAAAPIGVFDSGLGGLTVVRRLREMLPAERILYVADQAHVPYGGRELAEVCGFAQGISRALVAHGCKAVVMACNISSATALTAVQKEQSDVIVLGVIAPGAQTAAAQTANGRIGVLATAGTVRSGAYTRALHALNPTLSVTEVACPAFVPLVEAGTVDTVEAQEAAREYLAPLLAEGVDTVILGCTHYPFLLPTLQVIAPNLHYVDPAEQTIHELATQLRQASLFASADRVPRHLLSTTGDATAFAAQVHRFLPNATAEADVITARWQAGVLQLSEAASRAA